jgi:hypothetical protein
MLDLPGHPVLDKTALIGGCVRLPLTIDAERLRAEVAALPTELWGSGGRVGVHNVAQSIFLRGFAPAEGEKPIEDRPTLKLRPYARKILALVPADPLRCLLASLPPDAVIAPHFDRPPYFAKSLRLHFPVETHANAYMLCAGKCYVMRAGEVWALNNSAVHAVWNGDSARTRTHLICDFLPSPELCDMILNADHSLGSVMPQVEHRIAAAAAPRAIG